MIFRFTERLHGEHHHVRVFAASVPDAFEKIGELTMRPDEWQHFRSLLVQGGGGSLHRDGAIDVEWTADE